MVINLFRFCEYSNLLLETSRFRVWNLTITETRVSFPGHPDSGPGDLYHPYLTDDDHRTSSVLLVRWGYSQPFWRLTLVHDHDPDLINDDGPLLLNDPTLTVLRLFLRKKEEVGASEGDGWREPSQIEPRSTVCLFTKRFRTRVVVVWLISSPQTFTLLPTVSPGDL